MSRLPIAAPSRRLAAFALDYIWIALYLLVLAGVGSYLAFGPLAPQAAALFASPVVSDLIILAITVLPVTLYFARQEAARGGTWGKRRLGLRVVRADGARPSFGRALLRAGVKFTPWQIAHLGVARLIRLAEPPPGPLRPASCRSSSWPVMWRSCTSPRPTARSTTWRRAPSSCRRPVRAVRGTCRPEAASPVPCYACQGRVRTPDPHPPEKGAPCAPRSPDTPWTAFRCP
jgi:uncharacterized RDD family membrane protein YckC